MEMNVNTTLSVFVIAVVALLSVFFYVIPTLSRRSLFFAVTVDPEFRATPDASHILHGYRVGVILNALIALALAVIAMWIHIVWLAPVGVYWIAIGNYLAFLHGHKAAMAHRVRPSSSRVAELVPRREHLPGGWFAQIGPFLLLLAAAMILHAHWDAIPQHFPIHWDASGRANGFSDRTFSGVYGMLFFGAVICVMMALLALAIVKRTRKVELAGPGGARDSRVRRYNAIILVCAEYLIAIMFGVTALLPLRSAFAQQPMELPQGGVAWMMLATLAFIIFVVVVLMRAARTAPDVAHVAAELSSTAVAGDSTPDARWIGGMFYFNRADPAMFVEKRFGLGYTLNFGHPISWIIFAAIILVPLISALLLPHHN
jgi:uncharacterized membrane protein